ncbi:hypothetical protein T484DRAFT_1767943 [Baffinella frigidus]|nr:hypothetical protein T484DRAFT_1767943 [Cryptophyta sp. CCMP2293]
MAVGECAKALGVFLGGDDHAAAVKSLSRLCQSESLANQLARSDAGSRAGLRKSTGGTDAGRESSWSRKSTGRTDAGRGAPWEREREVVDAVAARLQREREVVDAVAARLQKVPRFS